MNFEISVGIGPGFFQTQVGTHYVLINTVDRLIDESSNKILW